MIDQDNKKIAKALGITEKEAERYAKINPTELADAIMIKLLHDILTELKKLNKITKTK